MTLDTLNPDLTPYQLYELGVEIADTHPSFSVAVLQVLGQPDARQLDPKAFQDATERQLAGVRSITEAMLEAWSARHDVPFRQSDKVLGELNRQRARLHAKRLLEEEVAEAEAEPYGSQYLMRSALRDMERGDPLIDGVLDRRTLAVITGRDQSFKSFLALDWLLCLSSGVPWQGHEVNRVPVLYVVGEGAFGLDARISAWEKAHGYDEGITEAGFFVRKSPVNLFRGGPPLDDLLWRIEQWKVGLVIFDTLRRCSTGANLNIEQDAGLVIDSLDRVKNATRDGSALIVAHTDKGDNDARGSGTLEDDADIVWRAKRDWDTGAVRFRLSKRKDGGPEGLTHTLWPKAVAGTGSVVLDETQPLALTQSVPKHVHEVITALRSPVFAEGASVSVLAETVGASRGALSRPLNWLIEEGQVERIGSGNRVLYKCPIRTPSHGPNETGRDGLNTRAGLPPAPSSSSQDGLALVSPSGPSSHRSSVPTGTDVRRETRRNGDDKVGSITAADL